MNQHELKTIKNNNWLHFTALMYVLSIPVTPVSTVQDVQFSCNETEMQLTCHRRATIYVTDAKYGHFLDSPFCSDGNFKTVTCFVNVTVHVANKCNRSQSCEISSSEWSMPCPEIKSNHFQVTYFCLKGENNSKKTTKGTTMQPVRMTARRKKGKRKM